MSTSADGDRLDRALQSLDSATENAKAMLWWFHDLCLSAEYKLEAHWAQDVLCELKEQLDAFDEIPILEPFIAVTADPVRVLGEFVSCQHIGVHRYCNNLLQALIYALRVGLGPEYTSAEALWRDGEWDQIDRQGTDRAKVVLQDYVDYAFEDFYNDFARLLVSLDIENARARHLLMSTPRLATTKEWRAPADLKDTGKKRGRPPKTDQDEALLQRWEKERDLHVSERSFADALKIEPSTLNSALKRARERRKKQPE